MVSHLLILLFLLFCALDNTDGHLCLMSPRQRGKLDISKSGSGTCFRHGAPCGGESPGSAPFEVVKGGQQYYLKWQQNFNHYTVGYPGYMDVAIAPVNSDNWTLLAFVSDKYVYAQDNQQNYSSFAVLPNIECPHCIIRARYNSHKPGEDIFYQCADITIKASESSDIDSTNNFVNQEHYLTMTDTLKAAVSEPFISNSDFIFRGFAYSPFDDDILYIVKVNMNGEVVPYGQFSFKVKMNINSKKRVKDLQVKRKLHFNESKSRLFEDSSVNQMFILDSVATVNEKNNLVTLYHDDDSMDIPASKIVEFDFQTGEIIHNTAIKNFDGQPINAIISTKDGNYITFSVQPNATSGFNFVVGQLYLQNNTLPYIYREMIRSGPEPLYVNYQWAELDLKNNRLYVLMGNENTPDQLKARIYTYDVQYSTFLKMTELQVEQFAFMNMHFYERTGKFYAMSPGMFFMAKYRPYWQLIEIDPMTGKVEPIYLNFGYYGYKGTFGGAIFNGLDQKTGMLYHVIPMVESETNIIIGVDVNTKNVTRSQLTNLRYVYNLAMISI